MSDDYTAAIIESARNVLTDRHNEEHLAQLEKALKEFDDHMKDDRRNKIEQLAIENTIGDPDISFDPGKSIVSEGEDNGAFVQAWVWVNFKGTQFDKEDHDICSEADCGNTLEHGEDDDGRCLICAAKLHEEKANQG